MTISQLRAQLSDLKKKEAIAQTRESLLNEEREKLLGEMDTLFKLVRKLGIIPEEDLTPSNLPNVTAKLQAHIDSEIAKSIIPEELR